MTKIVLVDGTVDELAEGEMLNMKEHWVHVDRYDPNLWEPAGGNYPVRSYPATSVACVLHRDHLPEVAADDGLDPIIMDSH